MSDRHLIIIGGGLAGMSCGVYALRSGYRVTIVEHNLALGGVCTAWPRGPYVVDGCIHWLTGGPFMRVYDELGITRRVPLNVLQTWATYRDVSTGLEIPFTRDLDALFAQLAKISPADAPELQRMRKATADIVALQPPMKPQELMGPRDALRMIWEQRGSLGTMLHFRQPMGAFACEHLQSPVLRRVLSRITPDTAPALFFLLVLGYLERGFLSRPVGGTAAFRDALEQSYRELGGQVELHATVDEILVTNGHASGVRLADGTMRTADAVVSTASSPETVLRLLGGRYDAEATRERLAKWKLFEPIVLASFGVEQAYADQPSLMVLDGLPELSVGGRTDQSLYVRICNDDPSFAPQGHSVVQAMVPTSYDFWASRGSRYAAETDATAEALIAQLAPYLPGLRESVRMTDIATPITYWNMARSWRGAYEGFMPTSESLFGHVSKKLAGLSGLYLAGQWVEPGGGVPTAVLSGRQAAELLCTEDGRPFVATS